MLPGDGGDGLAAHHGAHRRGHNLDPRHLAGQDIRGQHPLAVMTGAAANNRNHERDAANEDVQFPRDAGPRQPRCRAVTTPAPVPPQQQAPAVTRRRVDDCVVPAMIHIEYVSHVLKAASGESAKTDPGPPSYYRSSIEVHVAVEASAPEHGGGAHIRRGERARHERSS